MKDLDLDYVYIDKGEVFIVDITIFIIKIYIVIFTPIAEFIVEHGNSVMPSKMGEEITLVVFNSEKWLTIEGKTVVFISEYDNKITFRVKEEDINIILPQTADLTSSPSIDFKFPITFDFAEDSTASLNFKSVDTETGEYSELSVEGKESIPPIKYNGTPSNIEELSSLGSFIQSNDLEELNEISTTSSDGGSEAIKPATVVGVTSGILFALGLIIAILVRSMKKKKDQAARVDLIADIE